MLHTRLSEGQEIPPYGAMHTTVVLSNAMNEEMCFNTQYKIVIEQTNSTNEILVVKPIFPTNKIQSHAIWV